MIPGTAPEVARLGLARAQLVHHRQTGTYSGTPRMWAEIEAAKLALKLAERRELRARGKLPCPFGPSDPSDLHSVKLGVDMVEVNGAVSMTGASLRVGGNDRASVHLAPSVQRALDAVVQGSHQLWFDATGEAWLSFADPMDADLFALALDGDRS